MPRRTLWLLLVIGVFSLACYERAERNPYGRWFAEVMETIDQYYVEPVDNEKLFQGALDGMVGKLDTIRRSCRAAKCGSFRKRSTSATGESASR